MYTLADALYRGKKEEIEVTGATKKMTNTSGPAGIGLSKSRPSGIMAPAKFSAAALVLDDLFINKCISCMDGGDVVYAEVTRKDGVVVKFTCDDKAATFADSEVLHGYQKLIPPILYFLKNKTTNEELKNAVVSVKNNILSLGIAQLGDVLLFCDNFYYAYAKNQVSYEFFESELLSETVEAGFRSGLFSTMNTFDGFPMPPVAANVGKKDSAKKKTKKSDGFDFDKIKDGDYRIIHEWEESEKSKIPQAKSLDNFVPNDTFYSLVNKIDKRLKSVMLRMDSGLTGADAIGNDFVNCFVVGRPGTGKTTLAYALGAAFGMPVYSVAITENTEEDTFQGMTKVVDGKLTFVSTDVLNAFEHGGIIVLEEINLAKPSIVMGGLGQAIEFPFTIMKDGYIPVKRHPLCVVIGTMNVGTYGSKKVNQALSSRFKQTYTLNDPTKNDFVNILAKHNSDKSLCTWVYEVYAKIIAFLNTPSISAEDIALSVTLRGCIGVLENIEEGELPKSAVKNTLIGKIAESDLDLAEKVYAEIQGLRDPVV